MKKQRPLFPKRLFMAYGHLVILCFLYVFLISPVQGLTLYQVFKAPYFNQRFKAPYSIVNQNTVKRLNENS